MKPDPNQKNPKKPNSTSVPTTTIPDQKRPTDQPYSPPDSSRPTGGNGGKGRKPTGSSTISSSGGGSNDNGLPPFLGSQFSQVPDPNSDIPLFAVRNQKVVILTAEQIEQVKSKDLRIGALKKKGKEDIEILDSINDSFSNRVILTDCPELDDDGNTIYSVLLDYKKPIDVHDPFPELRLVDKNGKPLVDGNGNPYELPQADNYLVVSFTDNSGGTSGPPTRPPITTSQPINIQPTDFRPLAPGDESNYKQHSGHDDGPAVAVLDTGLKFNLHNQRQKPKLKDPYVYRDADNQKRRFVLAYQNEVDADCNNDAMKDNHLGYCALLAYRQEDFIKKMKLLSNMPGPYEPKHVMNSPFDDCVVLIDPRAGLGIKNIKSARHGTSITAIIQQNGDDAPVLPVKAFDNLGYATLFDVLNGLNYILHRCKKSNIRVVNTSWVFNRDEPLLRHKIDQLLKAGVLIIAASGNIGQAPNANLDKNKLYPACYSVDFPNVITVTTVRETHFLPDTLTPKQDSVINKILDKADGIGLGKLVDLVDDVVDAVAPVRGYVAVENYSRKFVNVGVVSKRGYFRSPFHNSPHLMGSSYACAFMTGFVIRQLRTDTALLNKLKSGLASKIKDVRQELLEATGSPDKNLAQEYTNGGYYLDGHTIEA